MTGGSASTFPATRLFPPSRQLIPARRGAVTKRFLQQSGIRTARQLRDVDTRWARQAMTVVGARTVMELRGVSCPPLESAPQSKKSITCSRTFGEATPSLSDLREAVALYTTRVAEKLRRGCRATNLGSEAASTGTPLFAEWSASWRCLLHILNAGLPGGIGFMMTCDNPFYPCNATDSAGFLTKAQ